MKHMFRVLLLTLALVLCLTPVLVACDVSSQGGGKVDPSEIEGKFIAKSPGKDDSLIIKLYQLEESEGKDTVKCSLVLYKAADSTILDYVTFDLKVNGGKANVLTLDSTLWNPVNAEVTIKDADGKTTKYTLTFEK